MNSSNLEGSIGYPVGVECGVCREQATDYYDDGPYVRNVCRSHWDKGKPPPQPLARHFEPVDLGETLS